MKNIVFKTAAIILAANSPLFAEEHADAALIHIQMAIEHGKAGEGAVLVHHSNEALIHAKKAAAAAKGESKSQIDAGIKALELAIEHGKINSAVYVHTATKAAEEAEIHIKAGNK